MSKPMFDGQFSAGLYSTCSRCGKQRFDEYECVEDGVGGYNDLDFTCSFPIDEMVDTLEADGWLYISPEDGGPERLYCPDCMDKAFKRN